jgi:hypothetical protein
MFFFYDPTLWLITVVLMSLGGVAVVVFLVLSLVAAMNCLEQCDRRRRKMEPGQVWLALIPAFGMVWIYFVILHVEESLEREYKDRGLRRPKDFGQTLGLSAVICWQAGALLMCVAVGALGVVAAAGLFVPYWMALTKHGKKLLDTRPARDDDEDDDRPRRRSRRDRDEDDEDDQPRRRPRRDRDDEEDEDDDQPRRRHRRQTEDEGEDEDDRPRRRR